MAAEAYEDRLVALIRSDHRVMALLAAVRTLGLDHWCIAAGTIRNLVWDHLHDFDTPTLPSDIDVLIYDDRQVDANYEKQLEERLTELVPDVEWEVVNQATIHTYTGDSEPYASITQAMSRWADLVTAVGARLHDDDSLEILAPAGLDDLFELRVKPNLITPTGVAVYRQRMANKGWQQRWPKITIEALDNEQQTVYRM